MVLKQTRINNLSVFSAAKEGEPIYIKVDNVGRFPSKLKIFGFDKNVENGDSILPSPFNNYAKKNAEAYATIDASLPLEKYTRTQYWTRNEWAGRDQTREVTDFVDITGYRRHRDWHKPYSVYFTYVVDDEASIVSDSIVYNKENGEKLKNTVNMILGLFGECTIDFSAIPSEIKKRRLDWDVLPPGEYPWEKVKNTIEDITKKSNKTQTAMMLRNCKTIVDMEPEFIAYGKSGYRGYVVFGFPKKDLYILESIFPNNATYVFNNDWETLSKMTKAQILSNELHEARIIHSASWDQKFKELFFNRKN